MDRIVHGVAKSGTRLSDCHTRVKWKHAVPVLLNLASLKTVSRFISVVTNGRMAEQLPIVCASCFL